MKEDLYALFDIPPDADENTIRKAYRKSTLKYHPDKNPDDKTASDKFNKLSVALTILGDKDKRIKYDIKRANKNRQQARLNEMDKARKAAREHMEMREKFGAEYFRKKASDMEKEQQMREEGKRVLEEEMRLMREEILKEKELRAKEIEKQRRRHQEFFRLKIKYNPNTLTESEVHKVLSAALNENCHIAFSKKKKSTGILETTNFEKARELVNDPLDKDNLKISWYETPVPPPQKPNINMTKAQADFFELEANVLSALRKR